MKLPVAIVINGPPGIGKSWLAGKLLPLLTEEYSGAMVTRFALREIIWGQVAEQMMWAPEDYEGFKQTIHPDGRTGRQILIDEAESKREVDTHYWDRQYTQAERYWGSSIVINDSMRKPEEHDWLTHYSAHIITIVMAPTHYSIGSQYDGDSGICLHPRGGFRCHDSNSALSAFTARMKNDPSFLTERL